MLFGFGKKKTDEWEEELKRLEQDLIRRAYEDAAYYNETVDTETLKSISEIRRLDEERRANLEREKHDRRKEIATDLLIAADILCGLLAVRAVTRKEKDYQEPILTQGDKQIVNNSLKRQGLLFRLKH